MNGLKSCIIQVHYVMPDDWWSTTSLLAILSVSYFVAALRKFYMYCVLWENWGKIGKGWCDIDPLKNTFFCFWVFYVCAKFGENRSRNATVRVLADGQTARQTDANRFYNLSHAICYSYGTDNNRAASVWRWICMEPASHSEVLPKRCDGLSTNRSNNWLSKV